MAQRPPSDTAFRVAELPQGKPTAFTLTPDAEAMQTIAEELGLSALRKLTFSGNLAPLGREDWQLSGKLGATVVQPCVVTLDPVTTRIDVDVTRRYLRDFAEPEEPEAEMPEDDTTEALGTWIDPAAVMVEALALAAPDFPRKDGAELGQMVYTEPGSAAMTDADARPFAGLADLKAKLEEDDNEG